MNRTCVPGYQPVRAPVPRAPAVGGVSEESESSSLAARTDRREQHRVLRVRVEDRTRRSGSSATEAVEVRKLYVDHCGR